MIPYDVGMMSWKDTRRLAIRVPVLVSDLAAVALAYSTAYVVRFLCAPFVAAFPITKGFPPASVYTKAAPVILFMWALALHLVGAYRRIQMQALDDAIRIFRGAIMGALLSMSAMFLYRDSSYSRLVFVMGGAFGYVFVYGFRELIKSLYVGWVQRRGRTRRVLVLGSGHLADVLRRLLKRQGDRAVLVRRQSTADSVRRTIVRSRIREVLLAHPEMSHSDTVAVANFCEERGIIFRLIPDILEIRMGEVLIDESLGLPTFQIKPVSLQGSAFVTKRIMDVALASLLIGLFFFPLLLIAILIKLTSSGPVFYEHERMGFRGRPFQFMKFRTMVQNADDLLQDLKAKSDRKGPVFKMKSDPRITAVGKFLRRYSLDEVPQVINVLKGEMSLVGPRPQVLWEARNYDDWARKRLNVLPGITGLWQVSGRAELTYEEMIELDIFYIEHWSPGLDIKILMRTIPAVLMGKGAY